MNQNFDHSQDADSELHQLLNQRPTPEHGPEFWSATETSITGGVQMAGKRPGSISRFGLIATVLCVTAGAGVLLAAFVGAQSNSADPAPVATSEPTTTLEAIETTLGPAESTATTDGIGLDVVAPELVLSDVQSGDIVDLDTINNTGAGIDYPATEQPSADTDLLDGRELVFLRPSGAVLRIRLNQSPSLNSAVFEASGQDSISTTIQVPFYEGFEDEDLGFVGRVGDGTFNAVAVAIIDAEKGTRRTHIFVEHPDHIIEIEIDESTVSGPTGFDDFLAGIRFSDAVG